MRRCRSILLIFLYVYICIGLRKFPHSGNEHTNIVIFCSMSSLR